MKKNAYGESSGSLNIVAKVACLVIVIALFSVAYFKACAYVANQEIEKYEYGITK